MNDIEPVVEHGALPVMASNPMVAVAMQKAVAEMQARVALAQARPRPEWEVVWREVKESCLDPGLAEEGVYEYPKGGQQVDGPSIRLMEEILRIAGNFDWGVRTLAETADGLYMEAYALDLETNTKATKEFFVSNEIKAYGKTKKLTDAREIYEHGANLGSRRMRACMEAICPAQLKRRAVEACDATMLQHAKLSDSSVDDLCRAYEGIGVSREMLGKRLGYALEKITPRQIVRLRKIYRSIRDGYSVPSDWFKGASQARLVEERLKSGAKPGKGSAPEEIVPQRGSEGATVNRDEVRSRQPESWKMSEEEIEDGLKQSKAVEKEVDVEPEPVDDWVEAATGDLK